MQRPEPAPGTLYLVGTPIGNLGDLSPRARELLRQVDVIACEDTRHSGQLLGSLGAKGRKLSFHQHNTRSRLPQLVELLKQPLSLALISDAGLPGISDPGEALVTAARAEGHEVICIPGPCAATTALVSSGLPSGRFCFEGFLPTKGRERQQRLAEIAKETRTTVIYEAPHRLLALLDAIASQCGEDRPLLVARELTKRYEQHIGPTVGAARRHFREHAPQGECTLVLGGAPSQAIIQPSEAELLRRLEEHIEAGASASVAARQLAEETGTSRRELYALLHRRTPH